MPIYTYRCAACGTEFEQLVRSDTKVACPDCRGRKLDRLMSLTARPASAGKASAPDALATGLAVGRKLKKLPVLTGNAFGFVGNRLYAAYRRQGEFMVEEGAAPEQVDAALEAFGFAMGPFAVADLSGLDIAWRMRKAQVACAAAWSRAGSLPALVVTRCSNPPATGSEAPVGGTRLAQPSDGPHAAPRGLVFAAQTCHQLRGWHDTLHGGDALPATPDFFPGLGLGPFAATKTHLGRVAVRQVVGVKPRGADRRFQVVAMHPSKEA